jgi:hypothetical protein
VAVVSASTQGVRTVNVYMVNVWGPLTPTPQVYPQGVSAGRESGLSRVASYTLLDNQTLEFTPETIPNTSGFYRRYYFDCVELGIKAPVRVRNANDEGGGAAINVDTVSPAGGVVLKPDLSTTYLKSQSFQVDSIRYVPSNGVYQSFQLYPHPSSDRDMLVRRLISPTPMKEDQDVPLVPEVPGHGAEVPWSTCPQDREGRGWRELCSCVVRTLEASPLTEAYMQGTTQARLQ